MKRALLLHSFSNFFLFHYKLFCSFLQVFCSRTFFVPFGTFFVWEPFFPFGTFFAHDSSPPRTTTTTKLLLGPLSIACGQKTVRVITYISINMYWAKNWQLSNLDVVCWRTGWRNIGQPYICHQTIGSFDSSIKGNIWIFQSQRKHAKNYIVCFHCFPYKGTNKPTWFWIFKIHQVLPLKQQT